MSENMHLLINLFNCACVLILAYLLHTQRKNYECLFELHMRLIDDYEEQAIKFTESKIPTQQYKGHPHWKVWISNYDTDEKLRLFVNMSFDEQNPKWVEFIRK